MAYQYTRACDISPEPSHWVRCVNCERSIRSEGGSTVQGKGPAPQAAASLNLLGAALGSSQWGNRWQVGREGSVLKPRGSIGHPFTSQPPTPVPACDGFPTAQPTDQPTNRTRASGFEPMLRRNLRLPFQSEHPMNPILS